MAGSVRAQPSGSLARGQPAQLFNEAFDTYVRVSFAIELVAEDRVSTVLRDAGGAVGELITLRGERKAMFTAPALPDRIPSARALT